MNKEVYDLLKEASKESEIRRKKKEVAEAREKRTMETFVDRSTRNTNEFYNILIREALEEYTNDPVSLSNFIDSTNNRDYYVTRSFITDEKISSKYDKGLSRKYNFAHKTDHVYFVFNEENKQMPVLLKKNDIYHISGGKISVYFKSNYIRELLYKAVNDELKDSVLDQSTIDMLVNSYNILDKKANKLKNYLERINKNAQIIYMEIYKKLLKEYISNPSFECSSIWINIAKDITSKNAILFNDSTYDDRIIYCGYTAKNGNNRYIPVQYSVLKNMLEEDSNFGFTHISDSNTFLIIFFNIVKFDETLVDIYRKEKVL